MANDLSAFNATAWSKRIVQKLDQRNVMLQLINKDYEGELQDHGDTVYIRTPGNVSMSTYTKNSTTISYQDLAPTKEPFTVSDASYFAFKVDDVDKAQNDLSAMDMYTKRAVVAINNAIDAKIKSKYTSAATSNKITGASSAAITLTSDTSATTGVYGRIAALAEAFSTNSVPEDGRWLVVHPTIRTLLWNDTSHFIRSSDLGDYVVKSGRLSQDGSPMGVAANNGFIGTILGFDVFMTATPITDGSSNYILGGTRDAITYAGVINQIEALRLQTSFANAVRGLLLHDAVTLAEYSKELGYIKCTN